MFQIESWIVKQFGKMRQKTLMSQTVSSLAPSAPAIVRLRVQIPSTKSSLFEFIKCDQKARLFFNIWPFVAIKFSKKIGRYQVNPQDFVNTKLKNFTKVLKFCRIWSSCHLRRSNVAKRMFKMFLFTFYLIYSTGMYPTRAFLNARSSAISNTHI